VVERVIPRGHFNELVLRRTDATLRAYVSGEAPVIGDSGFAHIVRALRYEDGVLQGSTTEPARERVTVAGAAAGSTAGSAERPRVGVTSDDGASAR